jgi:uncharacterized protein (TIGR03435 family)
MTPRCSILLFLSALSALAQPRFEAASAKPAGAAIHAGRRIWETPGRIHYTAVSLRELILHAYRRKDYQVQTPAWMDAEGFDIDATFPPESQSQIPEMLQTLLTERFKLQVHTFERPTKSLALRVRPGGSGVLKPVTEPGKGGMAFSREEIRGILATMENFADGLSPILGTPVVDQTGLPGRYTFDLKVPSPPDPSGRYDSSAIISSLKDIGLTVVSTTVTQQYLTADSAEQVPTAN